MENQQCQEYIRESIQQYSQTLSATYIRPQNDIHCRIMT